MVWGEEKENHRISRISRIFFWSQQGGGRTPKRMKELLYAEQTGKIIGAAIEVHQVMGGGYLEAVYQECLAREFRTRGIPFVEQPRLQIFYKGGALTKVYVPDFFAFDCIVLELKAAKALSEVDSAQILNALRASRMRVGLLMNFGEPSLKWKRFVHFPTLKPPSAESG